MKKLFAILFLFAAFIIYAQELTGEISPEDELSILLHDLSNAQTYGYKSHLLNITAWEQLSERIGTRTINFSQGSIRKTGRPLDFAISGAGFFKIMMPYGGIGYTRNGEFVLYYDGSTYYLVTKDGYRLFDTIFIKPGFITLSIKDDYSLITTYPNGEEINNGYLYIYDVDTNQLEYEDYYVIKDKYFKYSGTIEEISQSKVYNTYLEWSNVCTDMVIERLKRMYFDNAGENQ